MANPQQNSRSDTKIPVIEIDGDWTVEDLKTIDDCDDAFSFLTGVIASIETQIAIAQETGTAVGDRYHRLNRALRFKKAALTITQNTRARLLRQERSIEYQERVAREARLGSLALRQVLREAAAGAINAAIGDLRKALEFRTGRGDEVGYDNIATGIQDSIELLQQRATALAAS